MDLSWYAQVVPGMGWWMWISSRCAPNISTLTCECGPEGMKTLCSVEELSTPTGCAIFIKWMWACKPSEVCMMALVSVPSVEILNALFE